MSDSMATAAPSINVPEGLRINPKTRRITLKKPRPIKIVSLSDIHYPFAQHGLINHILEKNAGADFCVLNGDIFDAHDISFFPKNKIIPLYTEYRQAFHLVKRCSELFKYVLLLRGNHEDLYERKILKEVPATAQFLLQKPLLQRIADGEEYVEPVSPAEHARWVNHEPFKNVICPIMEDAQVAWWFGIGHTLFAHPSSPGGRTPGYLSRDFYKFINGKGHRPDCVCVGHVHRLNIAYQTSYVEIEQGALCTEMDYADSSRMRFRNNQVNGYAEVHQNEDGTINLNRTRVHCLQGMFQT